MKTYARVEVSAEQSYLSLYLVSNALSNYQHSCTSETWFQVETERVPEAVASSPPTSDAATPLALNGKGRVSTAVYAKNLEMKLEDMEAAKRGLELELRAMKNGIQKGQGCSSDEHQQLQVCQIECTAS